MRASGPAVDATLPSAIRSLAHHAVCLCCQQQPNASKGPWSTEPCRPVSPGPLVGKRPVNCLTDTYPSCGGAELSHTKTIGSSSHRPVSCRTGHVSELLVTAESRDSRAIIRRLTDHAGGQSSVARAPSCCVLDLCSTSRRITTSCLTALSVSLAFSYRE